mgnify:CR=1 FL=1
MAFFRCTYKATSLTWSGSKEIVNFNVILPEDCKEDVPWVLLLHGLSGTEDDWMRFTSVERYAQDKGFGIVMPAVTNSWYSDEVYGMKYYTFVTTELVDYVRSVFPLSKKREKTFVAGLSMGGYGALKAGLNNPSTFAAIASLSGVVDIYHRFCTSDADKWGKGWEWNATCAWGRDYEKVLRDCKGNKNNIYSLIRDFDYEAGNTPWIFTCCGTADRHYQTNVDFHNALLEKPIVHEWHEKLDGKHTWDVWDYYFPAVLDFFSRRMQENS